jgi:hypothetical protein
MTTDPVRPDRQRLSEVIQFPPEFLVLDWLVLRSFPASGNPVVQPLGKTVDDVLAVAVDVDDTARLKETQTLYDGKQFHPVVRGRWLSPVFDLFLSTRRAEDVPPATWSWIHGTGTIGEERKYGTIIHSETNPRALGGPVTTPIERKLPHGTPEYAISAFSKDSKLRVHGLGRHAKAWYTARLDSSMERY